MATYYISPAGNDTTGAGTLGNPWLTISKAYSSSTSGDTIYCIPTAGDFSFVTTTFLGSSRTITSDPANPAVWDGGSSNQRWELFADFTIKNITIKNCVNSSSVFFLDNSIPAPPTWTIENVTISNCSISNNRALIGNPDDRDVNVNLTSCAFIGCKTTNNANFQGYIGAGSGTLSMINNSFHNDVLITASLNILFKTNGSVSMINNIFYTGAAIDFSGLGSPTYSGSNNCNFQFTSFPSLTDNIAADPLFIDAANENLNLRVTSPCIDAGIVI